MTLFEGYLGVLVQADPKVYFKHVHVCWCGFRLLVPRFRVCGVGRVILYPRASRNPNVGIVLTDFRNQSRYYLYEIHPKP